MSANIKVSGKVYNGIRTISVKDDAENDVKYLYQGAIVQNVAEKDVNFYDYDGTLVASYSAADFLDLVAMPDNPTHDGLTADGWNWTLADAQDYVAAYGMLDIGQNYHTTSGKNEYIVIINESTGMTFSFSSASGEIDWGDGTIDSTNTHTYTSDGVYTIKTQNLCQVQNRGNVIEARTSSSVTQITGGFRNCWGLQKLAISGSLSAGQTLVAFDNCFSLKCIVFPPETTSLVSQMFQQCFSLAVVCFTKNITSFTNNWIFQKTPTLKSLTIPPLVAKVPYRLFEDMNSCLLKRVVVPNGIVSESAFYYCAALQKLVLGEGVTTIEKSAFDMCNSLLELVIPSTVTSIGNSAFSGMNCVKAITVLATTPPTLESANAIPLVGRKIFIPNGTLAAYEAANIWNNYTGQFVELPA